MTDSEVSRRRLLGAAGQGAALALLQPALARALTIPAANGQGSIMDVEHVVIFMQENRSFDHYFGTLSGVRGFADPHPAPLPSGDPVWVQKDKAGRPITPFRFDVENTNFPVLKSLDHRWDSGHAAWNGGRFDRWGTAKGPLTMGHLARQDIPYHFALADAFTVCDGYHSSLLGPTCPNRLYLMTGSVDPHSQGGYGPVIDNIDITQTPKGVVFGRGWKTYAERLQDAGVSWRLYRQGDNPDSDDDSDGGMNTLLAFESFRSAEPGSPLYERGVRPRRLEQLKDDVLKGQLPQVSWIVPPRLFCEHPKWPPAYGVEYLARILDALTANEAVWSKTVFLVMYDENDGYFDHVTPPVPPFSADQGLSTIATEDERRPDTGEPYGLGLRVPMLVMSPWSRGGWVCSETFDHTSVIRFLETRFGVREPNISDWRRTVCGDLTSAFDFATPNRAPPTDLAKISAGAPLPNQATFDAYKASVGKRPTPVAPVAGAFTPAVEPGARKARPLGYRLAVDARVADGRLQLDFANDGRLGAAFQVWDVLRPDTPPRRYTVGSDKSIVDRLALVDGRYRLVVHGPAGFLRNFEGSAENTVQVSLRSNPAGRLVVAVIDKGAGRGAVTISEARTQVDQEVRPKTDQPILYPLDLVRSGQWYDVSVAGANFNHRFIGRAENGRPGTSDPAMSSAKSGAIQVAKI
jgi:phospholipase C